ncbi:Uncharacterized protein OBRU01_16672, partial [Operophtera brumata]
MALAFVNLGTSLMADGRLAEAASALRAGSRADGVRVRDRREHDAARVSALNVLSMAGEIYVQLQQWPLAEHSILAALAEAPRHIGTHITLAQIVARNDAEYHSNLGAILHLNGKYAAAASSYRRALQLQPNDDITITNLKRVRALMTQRRT